MTDNEKIIPEYSSDAVLDALIRRKNEQELTIAEIAEASGVPESTVKRVFSRATRDPSFETVSRIARGMGISLDTLSEASVAPQPFSHSQMHALLNPPHSNTVPADRLIDIYERQLRFRNILIFVLLSVIVALLAFLIGVVIYDLSHPDRGWYTQAYQQWSGLRDAVHSFFAA